jgi:hypothetical protein
MVPNHLNFNQGSNEIVVNSNPSSMVSAVPADALKDQMMMFMQQPQSLQAVQSNMQSAVFQGVQP